MAQINIIIVVYSIYHKLPQHTAPAQHILLKPLYNSKVIAKKVLIRRLLKRSIKKGQSSNLTNKVITKYTSVKKGSNTFTEKR